MDEDSFESSLLRAKERLEIIRSISRVRQSSISGSGEIDIRIFNELKTLKGLMKDIEKMFLGLLLADARKMSQAAINNPNIEDEVRNTLDDIWNVLKEYTKEIEMTMKKARYLRSLADELMDEIAELQDSTGKQLRKLNEFKTNIDKNLSKLEPH